MAFIWAAIGSLVFPANERPDGLADFRAEIRAGPCLRRFHHAVDRHHQSRDDLPHCISLNCSGGRPFRPPSLVLRTGNPGMDTGREILCPTSPR
jgi:hypothetical protein